MSADDNRKDEESSIDDSKTSGGNSETIVIKLKPLKSINSDEIPEPFSSGDGKSSSEGGEHCENQLLVVRKCVSENNGDVTHCRSVLSELVRCQQKARNERWYRRSLSTKGNPSPYSPSSKDGVEQNNEQPIRKVKIESSEKNETVIIIDPNELFLKFKDSFQRAQQRQINGCLKLLNDLKNPKTYSSIYAFSGRVVNRMHTQFHLLVETIRSIPKGREKP
uniref:Uncharacterized protein n=1 Tax=Timspurckia oligopyrenoides TaxID=708627 RepID=A0A7S0ZBF9_9RHOD|mmetsp:Transcript_11259/g.20345  ORF Transcript_11259/g.20345 Transcript_11259/m.20345 type:complete len:221 (+) Transcript_11259:189-851(+)